MKRVVAVFVAFSIAGASVLLLRNNLRISPGFAGDGGPDFLWLFQTVALAVVSLLSGLGGAVMLWRLVFLNNQSRDPSLDSDSKSRD